MRESHTRNRGLWALAWPQCPIVSGCHRSLFSSRLGSERGLWWFRSPSRPIGGIRLALLDAVRARVLVGVTRP